MKLLFIVQSDAHKATAGVRIRYDRLASVGQDFTVRIASLTELMPEDLFTSDVYVFCKTYGRLAGVLAKRLRRFGKVVGIDMFDDYFSQAEDTRLQRFRDWLHSYHAVFDFALCSTDVMRRVIQAYAPDLPILVLPDPYPSIDPVVFNERLSAKIKRTRESGVVEVVWFGIGSNPFFAAGLQDLAAYSGCLADLGRGELAVNLTILTDRNALTAENLARLSRLPVPFRVVEWSVAAESEALARAFVAFVPVNGQPFSRAKSLNRALTAVSAGAQLLSPGFPLYAKIGTLVYDDAATLLADIRWQKCKIRPERLSQIEELLHDVSDVQRLAASLFGFLETRLARRRSAGETPGASAPLGDVTEFALAGGSDTDKGLAQVARTLGILLVQTPLATSKGVNFDILVGHVTERTIEITLRAELRLLVGYPYRLFCSAPFAVGKHRMIRINHSDVSTLDRPPTLPPSAAPWSLDDTALHQTLMSEIEVACRRVFPTVQFDFPAMLTRSPSPAIPLTA